MGSKTEESIKAGTSIQMESEEAEEFLGDGGILGAGFRAAMPGVCDAKAGMFAEQMDNLLANDGTGKTKLTKVTKKTEKPEGADGGDGKGTDDEHPLTAMEIVQAKLEEIKKECTDAKAYGMVLEASGICEATANGMLDHAEKLSEHYKEIMKMTKRDASIPEYVKPLEKIELAQDWFVKNEALAKKMVGHVRAPRAKGLKNAKKHGA